MKFLSAFAVLIACVFHIPHALCDTQSLLIKNVTWIALTQEVNDVVKYVEKLIDDPYTSLQNDYLSMSFNKYFEKFHSAILSHLTELENITKEKRSSSNFSYYDQCMDDDVRIKLITLMNSDDNIFQNNMLSLMTEMENNKKFEHLKRILKDRSLNLYYSVNSDSCDSCYEKNKRTLVASEMCLQMKISQVQLLLVMVQNYKTHFENEVTVILKEIIEERFISFEEIFNNTLIDVIKMKEENRC